METPSVPPVHHDPRSPSADVKPNYLDQSRCAAVPQGKSRGSHHLPSHTLTAIPKLTIPHKDLLLAPIAEAVLLLAVGVAGLLAHRPLLFASLGPTAYELVETPSSPSARPYNILVGHTIAVACGFFALYVFHVRTTAAVTLLGGLSPARLAVGALAAALTVLLTLLLRAMQPAAVSTTLLISLGSMDRWQDAVLILSGVTLLTLLGIPIRRWRLRSSPSYTEADFNHRRTHPASRPTRPVL